MARAVSEALSAAETRLASGAGGEPQLRAGAAVYARVFYEERLGEEARHLAGEVRRALCAEGRRECASFALPAGRLGTADADGVGLAVQLHFVCGAVE